MTVRGSPGAARLVAVSCVYFAVEAWAGPMNGPRCAVPDPLAVRGGVLMVPLVADRPGTDWPRTLLLIADDGRDADRFVRLIVALVGAGCDAG